DEISGVVRNSNAAGGLTIMNSNGVNKQLILSGQNTYTGTTTVGSAGSTTFLRANDGVGLPTASFLNLNGGVLVGSGPFTRSLGNSGSGKFQLTTSGGGFGANGGQLTVNIGGAG